MTTREKVLQFLSGPPSGEAFSVWQETASVAELRELVMHAQLNSMKQMYVDPARLAIADKLAQQAEATADKNLRIAEDSLQVGKDTLAAHHIVVALTRKLRWLTWALLILTAVLLVATLILAWIAHSTDERLREIYEQYQHNATQQKQEPTTPEKIKGSGTSVTQ